MITKFEEIQGFIPAGMKFTIEQVKPVFDDVIDKYLICYLGSEQYNQLLEWYNLNKPVETHNNTTVTFSQDLLPFVQRAIIRFAIYLSADQLDVQLTGSGFGVISTSGLTPASSDRVSKYKNAMERSGWDAIEMMLRYLEKNKSNYPLWSDSEAYTMATKNLVNSAEEFDIIVNIDRSRIKFFNYRNAMDQVEYLRIRSVISDELFDEIISQMKSDSVSDANKIILPMLKKACVFYTAGDQIDIKFNGMGDYYMNDVRKILINNPHNYPSWKNSSKFTAISSIPAFVNSADNTIYVFGAQL